MTMQCPCCQLWYGDADRRCACGYDFTEQRLRMNAVTHTVFWGHVVLALGVIMFIVALLFPGIRNLMEEGWLVLAGLTIYAMCLVALLSTLLPDFRSRTVARLGLAPVFWTSFSVVVGFTCLVSWTAFALYREYSPG